MVNKSKLKREHKLIILGVAAVVVIVLVILLFMQLFSKQAEVGDTVTVDYIGYYENGTIFDTNIESVGLQTGMGKPAYEQFTFIIGEGQVIPGFEEAIVGMSVGDRKNFTVLPEKGYGLINEEKILRDNTRELEIQRYSSISVSSYVNFFNKRPVVGDIFQVQDFSWNLKIVDVNDTDVKVENMLSRGQTIDVEGTQWNAIVTRITTDIIIFKQNPKLGDKFIYRTPVGTLAGVVISVNNTSFDVDTNPLLAGKTLVFDVEIKDIKKAE